MGILHFFRQTSVAETGAHQGRSTAGEEDEAAAGEEAPQPCSRPGIAARTKQRKRSSAALAAVAIIATATDA